MSSNTDSESQHQHQHQDEGRRIEQHLLEEAFSAQAEVSGNDIHKARKEIEREHGDDIDYKEKKVNDVRLGRYKRPV